MTAAQLARLAIVPLLATVHPTAVALVSALAAVLANAVQVDLVIVQLLVIARLLQIALHHAANLVHNALLATVQIAHRVTTALPTASHVMIHVVFLRPCRTALSSHVHLKTVPRVLSVPHRGTLLPRRAAISLRPAWTHHAATLVHHVLLVQAHHGQP
jgi:hypothetical protein